MTQMITPKKQPLQVADIFDNHIADYQKTLYGRNTKRLHPTF